MKIRQLCAARLPLALMLTVGAPYPVHAADNTPSKSLQALVASVGKWYEPEDSGEQEHLPHVDPASQVSKAAHWRDVAAALAKIDRDRLDERQRLDYDVLHYQAEVASNRLKYKTFEQPVNSDTSFWSELTDGARDPFATEKKYRRYLQHLHDIPRYFDEQTQNMKAGLARGFTPPRITLEGRDSALLSVTQATSVKDSPFLLPFRRMPVSIDAATQEKLRAEAEKTVQEEVLPAYDKLLVFFDKDYVAHARVELGADHMPDGADFYAAQIYEFTSTHLSAAQIHQIGLDEVAKLHEEMLRSMKATGFTGNFPAFLAFLRTDPQFYAKTPDELLKDAAWLAKQYDGVSARYFGFMPRARFAIKPVPADEAPFYTSGRGGPGEYLVNTYKLNSRPLYALPALTLHESAPGHAQQLSLVDEDATLAPFRKEYISAYGEGWALYCERLGDEMGIYQSEYDRFGMLSYQIWRASRLVVDTGIHMMGWSREQARQYLRDNTALPEQEIDTEVDRYIAWPAQALSYYLGESTIWKLRHKAEAALGPKFSLRAFHDTVLSTGSIPLPSLEDVVDDFIAKGGKGPHPASE